MIKDTESTGELSFEEAVGAVRRETDKILSGSHELIRKYMEHLKASSGKMIRGKALLICALNERGRVTQSAVKLAAAIETFHLATLVHDDIIDDADTRRGRISLQKKFGRKLAVICGDYLFSIALKLIGEVSSREDFINISMPDFIGRVCIGELDQLVNNRNFDITYYRYLKIISGKTAALFEAAFYAGALLGGADEALAGRYMRVGRYMGMIFQISDDCMDYEETQDAARKTVRADFEQGVITLPLIYAFFKKSEVKDVARKAGLSPAQARDAVIRSGGLEFARRISGGYYAKCIKAINRIDMHDDKRGKLLSVLDTAYYGQRAEEKL